MKVSRSVILIILSVVISNTLLAYGALNVSPSFLWAAVNSSLTEKKAPKHCAKIIFFNNETLGDPGIAESQRGIAPNSFINIEESIFNPDSDYSQWKLAEENVRAGTRKSIAERLEPCVIVVSFVLNATQYNLTADNVKYKMQHHLVDLLQHSTPIKSRHLTIIRISNNLDDFRFCTKAAKYPIRLVPDWELLLFDFFTDVRVIQGVFFENGEERHPYVRVSKEQGRWKWLCEDIIAHLEMEKTCNSNVDQKCLEMNPELQVWKPGTIVKNCTRGFRPRH